MNKLFSFLLVFLFCLSVVGCKQSAAPTGELNVSSLTTSDVISETTSTSEDVLPSDMETQAPVSAAQSTHETDSDVAVPSAPPAQSPETAPVTSSNAPVSPTESVTSIPTPVSSEAFTPAAFFCPPDYPSVYEHTEYSLDDFLAWINSDKALTEENGVYQAAVEYWRKRGAIYLITLSQEVSKIKWCQLYSDGNISLLFAEQCGYIIIRPFNKNEATVIKAGVNSYFQAKGTTVETNSDIISAKLANDASTIRFIARSAPIASKTADAVLEIMPFELLDHSITYIRILHWFQDGFYIRYYPPNANTPETSTIIDDSILSQLQFQDVSLSKTASTQIK